MKVTVSKAAVALMRWWVHLYTRGMDHAVADGRRAEVESDLWECLHDGRRDAGLGARSVEIMDRLVRGVPADLAWSIEERWVARSTREHNRRARMNKPLVTVVGLGAVALLAVEAQALWVTRVFFVNSMAVGLIFIAATCAVLLALFMAWKSPNRADARFAALALALSAAWLALMIVPSGTPSLARRVAFSISVSCGTMLFLRFAMVFPRPISLDDLATLRSRSPRARLWPSILRFQSFLISRPAVVWWVGAFLVVLTYVQATYVANPWNLMEVDLDAPLFWVPLFLFIPFTMALSALLVSFLLTSYRVNNEQLRRKIRWLALAALLGFVWAGVAMSSVFAAQLTDIELFERIQDAMMPVFFPVEFFVLLAGFTMAIFYEGAFDARPLIDKTALFGFLGIVLLFLFAGIEVAMSDLVLASVGAPTAASSWIAGGTVALAADPLRNTFKKRVDHWLHETLPATLLAEGP